jgi:hypothetical protein
MADKETLRERLRGYISILPLLGMLLSGCASSSSSPLWSTSPFSPYWVMETGNYKSFLTENQRKLAECGEWTECDLPLFNLGFVHAYPQSPYRDLEKARRYFTELQTKYPESSWTHQGQVLIAFMNQTATLEEAERRLQAELRTRDATIRKLRDQLSRSREIDLEMQKKERELLR